MIHIEFAGIPGSGKSFLCASIESILRTNAIPVVTVPRELAEKKLFFRIIGKFSTVVPQVFLHPLWTIRILLTIIRSRQKSVKGVARSFFTIAQISGMITKYRKSDVCLVLDQGSVQAIFTLLYESKGDPGLNMESLLPVPDILLETDGDDTVLLSRLATRSGKQSRIESDGLNGIEQSRDIFSRIHESSFYTGIPLRICVPDERTDIDITGIAQQILERISNDLP